MKQNKKVISISLWVAFLIIIRVLYYLFSYSGVMTDSYGFYSLALFNIENGERQLSSGLGFEYINNLVLLIKILGNDINNIFVAQLSYEMLALVFFVFTFLNFFGKKPAIISSTLLAISPIYIDLLRVVSPEEYFLLYFSVIFFALSLYFKYIQTHILDRSIKNELIVVVIGIFIGKILVWNYLGIVPFIIFTIISFNSFRLMDDRFSLQMRIDANIEDKDKIMSLSSQLSHFALGIIIGLFFTLLKFTGYTGFGIVDQFYWWIDQLKKFPKRCMDFNTPAAIWLLVVIFFAFLIDELLLLKNKKMDAQKQLEQEKLRPLMLEQEHAFIGRKTTPLLINDDNYFITEDGRKVKYIDNPLPGPKKKNVDLRFNLDSIKDENNSFGIYDNELKKIIQTDNMVKAGVGIENVVKLQPNYKDVVALNPLDDSYEKLNKIGSMKNLRMIKDFDYAIDDKAEFDNKNEFDFEEDDFDY